MLMRVKPLSQQLLARGLVVEVGMDEDPGPDCPGNGPVEILRRDTRVS